MAKFKQHVIEACEDHLRQKISSLQKIMFELAEACNNETKSSAGDKHETARAMMQLEQEKVSKQIAELGDQKKEFDKINFTKKCTVVSPSALVTTDKGTFFIAVIIGKLIVSDKPIFVISNQSPLAIALKGKANNDITTFNQVSYTIHSII